MDYSLGSAYRLTFSATTFFYLDVGVVRGYSFYLGVLFFTFAYDVGVTTRSNRILVGVLHYWLSIIFLIFLGYDVLILGTFFRLSIAITLGGRIFSSSPLDLSLGENTNEVLFAIFISYNHNKLSNKRLLV